MHSYHHCCSGKAVSSAYSECLFVTLVIQHAMHMRHSVICVLSGSTIFFFSTSPHKRYDCRRKKVIENKYMCFVFFYGFYETFRIPKRTERDMIANVYWSSCEVPVILVRFYWNLNFLNRFSENTHVSNLMKNRPMEAELLHLDEQLDRHDESNSRFPQFCESA